MAFSWSEYRCFMGGRFVTGIRGFKYKAEREIEAIYAEGDEPADVGYGNRKYTSELKFLQSELEAIISSGGGDAFSIPPFTVVHSYIPKNSVGAKIVTDILEGVQFMEIEKAMEQGAKFMESTTPMFVKKIKYNTTSPY
jgi:hypothetical protein